MTPEVLLIGAVRLAGSLLVLRWALAGAVVAILVDLSDLFLLEAIDLGGIPDYQRFDKVADQVYLAAFLVASLRWSGVERAISVALYAYRMAGFAAFELTGERNLLLLFPNVFEFWFLVVAALHHRPGPTSWTPARLAVVLAVLTALKLVQEWALHVARLFDRIGAFEALESIRRWLLGP